MIQKIDSYILECDGCKTIFEDHNGYTIFPEESHPIEAASDEGWEDKDGKWYCDNCHSIDDDGNVVIYTHANKS